MEERRGGKGEDIGKQGGGEGKEGENSKNIMLMMSD